MQIIDSHTHLDFDEFNRDRRETIQRAIDSNVSKIIVSSTIAKRWGLITTVCDEYKTTCFPAYGLHPMFMSDHDLRTNFLNDIDKLKAYLQTHYAVAIGEIGLDFFIPEADKNHRVKQIQLFVAQLELAVELNLPVIIHARKSLDIVLKYLRRFPPIRGSIHSFSGSEQQAKQLIDLGFYLSFGGPITYDRATRLHKLIKTIPLDFLLVESDSPDQPDANHHLQRNEPAFIINVINKIANIKELSFDRIADETSKNAIDLFSLGNS